MPDIEDDTRMIYLGRRMPNKGKTPVHAFEREGGDAEGFTYYPKAKAYRFMGAQIGRIYNLAEGLPEVWGAVEVGEVDREMKESLQLADRLAVMKGREMKQAPAPEWDSLVARMRRLYREVPLSKRTDFEVWLLKELRK